MLPLAKTRCLFINGTQLHAQSTQSVRFRRFKPGRLGEKSSTLREISDKIQCSLPKIQSSMDFNNNQSVCKHDVLSTFSVYFAPIIFRLTKLWCYGVTMEITVTIRIILTRWLHRQNHLAAGRRTAPWKLLTHSRSMLHN